MKASNTQKPICIAELIVSITGCAGWLGNGPVSRSGTPSFGTVDRDQNDVISRAEAANSRPCPAYSTG